MLLPEAYYEATILSRKVEQPCKVGQKDLCRHYSYPNVTSFDSANGEGGFTSENNDPVTEFFENEAQLSELKQSNIPLLNEAQQELHLDLTLAKPGPHVLIINYITPDDDLRPHEIFVETSTDNYKGEGMAILPPCPYSMICRQVVIEEEKRINFFNFDSNFVGVVLKVRM